MLLWKFSHYNKEALPPFEHLLKIFQELLLYTAGEVSEALAWLTELDKEYGLTKEGYGMADFIQELMDKGYLQQPDRNSGALPNSPDGLKPSSKMELAMRKKAMKDIFGDIKKTKSGRHSTKITGRGEEPTAETRQFEFGDKIEQLALSETLKNAYLRLGQAEDFGLHPADLQVQEQLYQSQSSTVLMIDISHSMILYGEDRITPAKKVALALAEYIQTQFPKDTLDIIVFGDDAWPIALKDVPYLQVGPYHTNTVAGLELAMTILRRRRNPNKQIMMITDGKPTCIKKGNSYYKNSFGLDRQIVQRTLTLAQRCRKLQIPITTFMIAQDPYLVRFVDQFTQANGGQAFYSSLQGLGDYVFKSYKK
jgi:uncharacterized protein with von Willebrand factor type A (vWA) domain